MMPADWLMDWFVTGMAMPMRSGVAVSLSRLILESPRATPSPATEASTVS